MSETSMSELLTSQIEIVEQAKLFFSKINQEQYCHLVSPHFSSSAGEHMRHILDHYMALKDGYAKGMVDYDLRKRGSLVESSKLEAEACWEEIATWLEQVCNEPNPHPIVIKSEVSIEHKQFAQVSSSLARELIFVASHAIHHFSLIAVICSLQGVKLDGIFGLAPATATHLREVVGQ